MRSCEFCKKKDVCKYVVKTYDVRDVLNFITGSFELNIFSSEYEEKDKENVSKVKQFFAENCIYFEDVRE